MASVSQHHRPGAYDRTDRRSMSLSVALLVAAASTCTIPASEEAAQTALPYSEFDGRDGPFGWRALAAAGCADSAVALLARYAEAHRGRLALAQGREIAFHIGQVLAMVGREQEAIAPLEQALDAEAPAEWGCLCQGDSRLPSSRHDRPPGSSRVVCSTRARVDAPAHHRWPRRVPEGAVHEGCPLQDVSTEPGPRRRGGHFRRKIAARPLTSARSRA